MGLWSDGRTKNLKWLNDKRNELRGRKTIEGKKGEAVDDQDDLNDREGAKTVKKWNGIQKNWENFA